MRSGGQGPGGGPSGGPGQDSRDRHAGQHVGTAGTAAGRACQRLHAVGLVELVAVGVDAGHGGGGGLDGLRARQLLRVQLHDPAGRARRHGPQAVLQEGVVLAVVLVQVAARLLLHGVVAGHGLVGEAREGGLVADVAGHVGAAGEVAARLEQARLVGAGAGDGLGALQDAVGLVQGGADLLVRGLVPEGVDPVEAAVADEAVACNKSKPKRMRKYKASRSSGCKRHHSMRVDVTGRFICTRIPCRR